MSILPTEKTKPNNDPSKLRWLFYAEPKTYKTTLASGFNDPIFAVTEKSTEAMSTYTTEIKKWEDFQALTKELCAGGHRFKTLVVDVVDGLYRYCVRYACEKLKIDHLSDAGFAKAYHLVDNEFEHYLNKLEMAGLGIIFNSHLTEKEVQLAKGGSYTKIIPGLAPRGRMVLEPKVTVIGRIQWEKVRKQGVQALVYESKLVIDFKQTELLLVGDRTGKLPAKLVLHTIPEDMILTEDIIADYAKKNYQLIESYFKDKQLEKEEIKQKE